MPLFIIKDVKELISTFAVTIALPVLLIVSCAIVEGVVVPPILDGLLPTISRAPREPSYVPLFVKSPSILKSELLVTDPVIVK